MMQKIGSQRMAIIDWPIGIVYGFVAVRLRAMTWRSIGVAVAHWKRGYIGARAARDDARRDQ